MSKLCSFSHFRWSNTQAGKAGEASQTEKAGEARLFSTVVFVHFISFPNGRCSRHLRPPCPIYEN